MMVFQQKMMIILMIELGIYVVYMAYTSMCQFHTGWSHFSRLLIMTVFQQKLMIIIMIEIGIWVKRARANFIRGGHTFQG